MNTTLDYYSVLGINRKATSAEIKSAYRKLVFQYHPDRNPDDQHAAEKFARVLEAYETLSDAAKRTRYDEATRPLEEEEPVGGADGIHEKSSDPFGAGFRFRQDFGQKIVPEPKCPQCSVVGTDYIISRKGSSATSRGKQFVLAPFNVIFCSECGHVYGVSGNSG